MHSTEASSAVLVNQHVFEAPWTPSFLSRFYEHDLADGQILDDTEVVERSPKLPKLEIRCGLVSGWSDRIRMVELTDDEQWEQEIGDTFCGDAEIDDDVLEECDMTTQKQPLDEGRPPSQRPQSCMEDGVLLSRRSVFDWRVKEDDGREDVGL